MLNQFDMMTLLRQQQLIKGITMFTLQLQEYASSLVETRHNQPLSHCLNMLNKGGFYKVVIIDSNTGVIYA